jgi:hypothetical protein
MKRPSISREQRCCHTARKELVEELRRCYYCTTSIEEHNACREAAARRSGKQAKSCLQG